MFVAPWIPIAAKALGSGGLIGSILGAAKSGLLGGIGSGLGARVGTVIAGKDANAAYGQNALDTMLQTAQNAFAAQQNAADITFRTHEGAATREANTRAIDRQAVHQAGLTAWMQQRQAHQDLLNQITLQNNAFNNQVRMWQLQRANPNLIIPRVGAELGSVLDFWNSNFGMGYGDRWYNRNLLEGWSSKGEVLQ